MKFALLLMTAMLFNIQAFAQEVSTTPVDATVSPGTETTAPATIEESAKKDPRVVQKITEKYNISAEDLAKLREQKLGYGQIVMALELSKASGKSMDEITTMLKEKKSLQQVAKDLNLSKDDLKKIRENIRPMREERKEDRKEGRKEDRREERKAERKEERKVERKEERKEERKTERRENRGRK